MMHDDEDIEKAYDALCKLANAIEIAYMHASGEVIFKLCTCNDYVLDSYAWCCDPISKRWCEHVALREDLSCIELYDAKHKRKAIVESIFETCKRHDVVIPARYSHNTWDSHIIILPRGTSIEQLLLKHDLKDLE